MSSNLVTADKFDDLFLSDTPFLDVRAEVEFAKGHFPTSKNMPILNDGERQQVGTCYKQQGKQAAIALGHELVSGELKAARIEAWRDFTNTHANTHVYCWRGGMRSNFAAQWMRDAGIDAPVIEGGYKALRRRLMDEIESVAAEVPMLRIGGKTGTAKTVLVNEVAFSVDLEAHANHRGSSFGRRVSGAPTQTNFENALAIDLLRKRKSQPNGTLVVEDESNRIGANVLPQVFYAAMRGGDLGIIEMPLAFRIERILREYVIEMSEEFAEAYPDSAEEKFSDYLTQSLFRVRKRLGSERYGKLSALMEAALDKQHRTGDASDHESWIEALLNDYYDPMCDYQLDQQRDQIAFRGDYDAVLEWARTKSAETA